MGRATAAIAAVTFASCALETPPEAELQRVEPTHGLNDRPTAIALFGRGLEPSVSEDSADLTAEGWTGTVGGRALQEIRSISPEWLEAAVPSGVPSGTHDIVLISGERRAVLPAAYTAVRPVAPRLDLPEPPELRNLPLEGGTVVLHGAGLHNGSTVLLDADPVNAEWLDDQSLRIAVPPGQNGWIRVEVQTPVGRTWRDDLVRRAAR